MEPLQELPFQFESDEQVEVTARTQPHLLAVTDRRVVVGSEYGMALDLPIEALRRIELDVEAARPATIVLVPHDPRHPPQVLTVPHDELEAVTRAMYLVGGRLGRLG